MAQDISTAILMGGRAQRMGGLRKALFTRNGVSVIERTVSLCDRESTFLVGNEKAPYLGLGLPIIEDKVIGKGAPGALVTALLAAKTEWVRVLACDLPCIEKNTLDGLHPCSKVDVRLYRADGHPQYLVSLWRSTIGLELLERVRNDDVSFKELLGGLRVDWLRADNPAAFYNMNDIESAKELGYSPQAHLEKKEFETT